MFPLLLSLSGDPTPLDHCTSQAERPSGQRLHPWDPDDLAERRFELWLSSTRLEQIEFARDSCYLQPLEPDLRAQLAIDFARLLSEEAKLRSWCTAATEDSAHWHHAALDVASRAADMGPSPTYALLAQRVVADSHCGLGHHQQCVESLRRGTETEPRFAEDCEAPMWDGYFLSREGDEPAARLALEQALTANGDCSYSAYGLTALLDGDGRQDALQSLAEEQTQLITDGRAPITLIAVVLDLLQPKPGGSQASAAYQSELLENIESRLLAPVNEAPNSRGAPSLHANAVLSLAFMGFDDAAWANLEQMMAVYGTKGPWLRRRVRRRAALKEAEAILANSLVELTWLGAKGELSGGHIACKAAAELETRFPRMNSHPFSTSDPHCTNQGTE